MKNPRTALLAAFSAFALSLTPSISGAGLFSSERSEALEKADAALKAAIEAGESDDPLNMIALLRSASVSYLDIADKWPDYEANHVSDNYLLTRELLDNVTEKIRKGEIKIPNPDEILGGAGTTPPRAMSEGDNRPDASDPGLPRIPVPTLIEADGPASTAVLPGLAGKADTAVRGDPRLHAPIPNPKFTDLSAPPPVAQSSGAQDFGPDISSIPASDAERLAVFSPMIRGAQASDAMILLEDVVEAEGDSVSLTTRILFVRALLQCGGEINILRAQDELSKISGKEVSNPSVRSLRAAVALAQGRFIDAMFETDTLVKEYPDFSDGYINFAWILMMIDPVGNRDLAKQNYQAGLSRGARRDRVLEKAIGLTISH